MITPVSGHPVNLTGWSPRFLNILSTLQGDHPGFWTSCQPYRVITLVSGHPVNLTGWSPWFLNILSTLQGDHPGFWTSCQPHRVITPVSGHPVNLTGWSPRFLNILSTLQGDHPGFWTSCQPYRVITPEWTNTILNPQHISKLPSYIKLHPSQIHTQLKHNVGNPVTCQKGLCTQIKKS